MNVHEQIKTYIGRHGMWKWRLEQAIQSGSSAFQPDIIQSDISCDFGKWLHGEMPAKYRHMPHCEAVIDLHAKFHREAARVLDLALKGEKEEAGKALGQNSEFVNVSVALVSEMMKWAESLKDE